MKADNAITVSSAVIEQWERDAVGKEREAAKLIEDAKALRARAEAGKLILGLSAQDSPNSEAEPATAQNMTADIRRMANDAPEPLTRKELKKRLLALGYAPSRLTSYFYTPIHRLKEAKQITVLENGRIWKAP
jgi:hypothetical protein